MDRYSIATAARYIDDYYLPAPHEISLDKCEDAFDRAKTEIITNMKNHINNIESMSFDEFINQRKKGFK